MGERADGHVCMFRCSFHMTSESVAHLLVELWPSTLSYPLFPDNCYNCKGREQRAAPPPGMKKEEILNDEQTMASRR